MLAVIGLEVEREEAIRLSASATSPRIQWHSPGGASTSGPERDVEIAELYCRVSGEHEVDAVWWAGATEQVRSIS